ncbi:MAG: hypothetical protein V4764_13405 [Burkholderia sp.]
MVTAFALADFAQRAGIPANYLSRDLRRIAGFVTREAQRLQQLAPMIPAAFKALR